jgi:hypothetical protein
MKNALKLFSIATLAAVLVAAIAYAGGHISEAVNKQIMLTTSIAWFVTAPFWMRARD